MKIEIEIDLSTLKMPKRQKPRKRKKRIIDVPSDTPEMDAYPYNDKLWNTDPTPGLYKRPYK